MIENSSDLIVLHTQSEEAWANEFAGFLEEAGLRVELDCLDVDLNSNMAIRVPTERVGARFLVPLLSQQTAGRMWALPDWTFYVSGAGPLGELIPICLDAVDLPFVFRFAKALDCADREVGRAVDKVLERIAPSQSEESEPAVSDSLAARPQAEPSSSAPRDLDQQEGLRDNGATVASAHTGLEGPLHAKAAAGETETPLSEGQALYQEGYVLELEGNILGAFQSYSRALASARAACEGVDESAALTALSRCHYFQGEPKLALSCAQEALGLGRELEDRASIDAGLRNLCWIHDQLENLDQAHEARQKLLELAVAAGDKGAEARALQEVGRSYYLSGDDDQALFHFEKALGLAKDVGDEETQAYVAGLLGSHLEDMGDLKAALQHYGQQLALLQKNGDRVAETQALLCMAQALFDSGEANKALVCKQESLDIAIDIKDRGLEGLALESLASTLVEMGDLQAALEHLKQRQQLAQEEGNREDEARAVKSIASLYYRWGKPDLGAQFRRRYLQLTTKSLQELPNDAIVRRSTS